MPNTRYNYVTGSGKIQYFAYSTKIEILLLFSVYNVWITGLLNMRIYNSTVSELQHFVTQPLILPILMAVNLHVLILIIQNVGFLQIRSHNYYYDTYHSKYTKLMLLSWNLQTHSLLNQIRCILDLHFLKFVINTK